jgi:hypothetical protein
MKDGKLGVIGKTTRRSGKTLTAADMERLRDRDSEMVTGIFKNYENPGMTVAFGFKLYKGDEIDHYILEDGERYRIPRGVARHLNQDCFYYEYKQLKGAESDAVVQTGLADGRLKPVQAPSMARKVYRFGFQSLDFMDSDLDMSPVTSSIIEVKTA